jgi:hypothetical protein
VGVTNNDLLHVDASEAKRAVHRQDRPTDWVILAVFGCVEALTVAAYANWRLDLPADRMVATCLMTTLVLFVVKLAAVRLQCR